MVDVHARARATAVCSLAWSWVLLLPGEYYYHCVGLARGAGVLAFVDARARAAAVWSARVMSVARAVRVMSVARVVRVMS